jgi:hypothetical protein
MFFVNRQTDYCDLFCIANLRPSRTDPSPNKISHAAATMKRAEEKKVAAIEMSVDLIPTAKLDVQNASRMLNSRTFNPQRAVSLCRIFNRGHLTVCHVAVEFVDEKARAWRNKHLDIIPALLEIVKDREGNVKESYSSKESYKAVHQYLGLDPTQPITRDKLLERGLLIPDSIGQGHLPDGLDIHPLTGNHSSTAARWFRKNVSPRTGRLCCAVQLLLSFIHSRFQSLHSNNADC